MAPVRGVQDGPLGAFIRNYIERVVNRRDVTAVDDFVSTDYVGRGPGWAANIEELRRFYVEQIRNRPEWHVEVQRTFELGDSVVILALAGGDRHKRWEEPTQQPGVAGALPGGRPAHHRNQHPGCGAARFD